MEYLYLQESSSLTFKYVAGGALSRAPTLRSGLVKIIHKKKMRKEVPLITSPKFRMKQFLKRQISLTGILLGHTILLPLRMRQPNWQVSLMHNWVIFSADRLRSKNTNGHRHLPWRLHVSTLGHYSFPIRMSLTRSTVTVTCVAIFI